MQQRTRRLAIVFGGTLIATIGALAACSTDNGTTPLPGQGGTDSGRDTSKADSTTQTGQDGDITSSDAGADCSTAPRLHTTTDGYYCSFSTRDAAAGDAGGTKNCANDETCCNPGKTAGGDTQPGFCAETPIGDKGGDNGQTACAAQAAANGTQWTAGGSTWECADKSACEGSQVCCLFTWADAGPMDKVNIGNTTDKNVPKACGALQAFKQGGTRCAASCAANEIPLCSKTDDNCSGNQKCTPFSAFFRDLGTCK